MEDVIFYSMSHLWEVTTETGGPAALGAGPHAANVLFTQDLITALRIGAPRQVRAALHKTSQKSIFILEEKAHNT